MQRWLAITLRNLFFIKTKNLGDSSNKVRRSKYVHIFLLIQTHVKTRSLTIMFKRYKVTWQETQGCF